MPTYTCTAPAGRLTKEQKAKIAAEITRVHKEVTGASSFFAQVIFHDIADGNYFMGGKPLAGEQIFINGQIRGGRSALDRSKLMREIHREVAAASGTDNANVWVYLTDLPPRDMIEYGHVLPEAGSESQWLENLPAKDREKLLKIGV